MKDIGLKIGICLLVLSILGLTYTFNSFVRNQTVYDFRMMLIDQISDQCNTQPLWKEYDKVSYQGMVYKFWKPMESFYDGTDIEKMLDGTLVQDCTESYMGFRFEESSECFDNIIEVDIYGCDGEK